MKLKDHQLMYVKSMGKLLKITAIFTDVDECNKYCETRDEGVIAEYNGVIFVAHLYDKGIEI